MSTTKPAERRGFLFSRAATLKYSDSERREDVGIGAGFAPRQLEQDVVDVAVVLFRLLAGGGIGLVFMLRDAGRLGVGGAIRHGIDRRALHLVAVAGQGVGVDRDEKRGVEPARDAHALAERHECVVLAGQDDLVMVAGAQFGRQNLGEIEHDEFLDGVVAAQRAGVDAAVAGIDHDHGLLRGAEARRGGAAARRVGRGGPGLLFGAGAGGGLERGLGRRGQRRA